MKLDELTSAPFQNDEIICEQRAIAILALIKERIALIKQSYKNVAFQVSGIEPYCTIHIIGNKIVGNKYDLEVWKTVPLYKCSLQSTTFQKPRMYLDMRINFSGQQGSEDWLLSEEKLTIKIDKALHNAINDFTMQDTNTL